MIVYQHSDECSGAPVSGKLTGECDCVTFQLTEQARRETRALIAMCGIRSTDSHEDQLYLAVRFELLASALGKAAHQIRCNQRRAERKAKAR